MNQSTKLRLTGQRNQCPTCKEYFNSNSAFDRHRTGSHTQHTRHCLTVSEMTADGMVKNKAGFWGGQPPAGATLAKIHGRG